MNVIIINENKKDFLDLLLLADEQEDMIDKYLDRGTLFALYDDDLKSICVVTDEGDGTFEMQSLATYPQFQGKGYARYLINHVCDYYKDKGTVMVVGTGDTPIIVPFYENSGFVLSHRVENYFIEHYNEPMFEHGVQLKDKVFLKRNLRLLLTLLLVISMSVLFISCAQIFGLDTAGDEVEIGIDEHFKADWVFITKSMPWL